MLKNELPLLPAATATLSSQSLGQTEPLRLLSVIADACCSLLPMSTSSPGLYVCIVQSYTAAIVIILDMLHC